jgi:hypothetical protein
MAEVSYCYVPEFVYQCTGHWDDQLRWHQGHMWPQDAMLIDLLEDLCRYKSSGVQPRAIDGITGSIFPVTQSTPET